MSEQDDAEPRWVVADLTIHTKHVDAAVQRVVTMLDAKSNDPEKRYLARGTRALEDLANDETAPPPSE